MEPLKHYEIIEFFDGFNRIVRLSNGKFTKSMQYFYEERELIEEGNIITRVKRLRDSKIFQVNDHFHDGFAIKSFQVTKEGKLNIILQ